MSCHSRWNGIQLSEIVSWCDVLKSVQEVLRGTGKFILFRIVYSLGDSGEFLIGRRNGLLPESTAVLICRRIAYLVT